MVSSRYYVLSWDSLTGRMEDFLAGREFFLGILHLVSGCELIKWTLIFIVKESVSLTANR